MKNAVILFIICLFCLLFVINVSYDEMFSILGKPQANSIVIADLYIWILSSDLTNMKQKYYLKNGVFWVVTPCGSCKNRRFGGTWRLLHQGNKNR
jgi:hypothetical protein